MGLGPRGRGILCALVRVVVACVRVVVFPLLIITLRVMWDLFLNW